MKTNAMFIHQNPQINIISYACSKCYMKENKKTYNEKGAYIEKRIATGHESILEHGNFIIKLEIDKKDIEDLLLIYPCFKYLNTCIKQYKDYYILLIGGSPRAYKHIFRTYIGSNNIILNEIRKVMQEYTNLSLYEDFILDDIFSGDDNSDICEIDEQRNKITPIKLSEYVTILNIDNIVKIFNQLDGNFNINELLDMCTITMDFNNISRIISQQFTRHRNGITQESQRYVDYTNKRFNSPEIFNNTLEKNKIYNYNNKQFTLQELGDDMVNLYSELVNQGLRKEDARAFLPGNVTTSFVMTFTLRNLITFLKLRTHSSAQNEIRIIAESIEKWFIEYMKENINEDFDLYAYIEPNYKYEELYTPDIIPNIEEDYIPLEDRIFSENDYI